MFSFPRESITLALKGFLSYLRETETADDDARRCVVLDAIEMLLDLSEHWIKYFWSIEVILNGER